MKTKILAQMFFVVLLVASASALTEIWNASSQGTKSPYTDLISISSRTQIHADKLADGSFDQIQTCFGFATSGGANVTLNGVHICEENMSNGHDCIPGTKIFFPEVAFNDLGSDEDICVSLEDTNYTVNGSVGYLLGFYISDATGYMPYWDDGANIMWRVDGSNVTSDDAWSSPSTRSWFLGPINISGEPTAVEGKGCFLTLNSPSNGTMTYNSTPGFSANATCYGDMPTECYLTMNGTNSGTNSTDIINGSSFSIVANSSESAGTYSWDITCTNTTSGGFYTNTSDIRYISIYSSSKVALSDPKLIGWWTLDEEDGSYYNLVDFAATSNSGITYNQTGIFGKDAYFPTAGGYVSAGDYGVNGNASITAHVKTVSLPFSASGIFVTTPSSGSSVDTDFSMLLQKVNGSYANLKVNIGDGSNYDIITSDLLVLVDTNYHFIAVTLNPTNVTFFVDDQVESLAHTYQPARVGSSPYRIGYLGEFGSYWADAYIDEITFWSRELQTSSNGGAPEIENIRDYNDIYAPPTPGCSVYLSTPTNGATVHNPTPFVSASATCLDSMPTECYLIMNGVNSGTNSSDITNGSLFTITANSSKPDGSYEWNLTCTNATGGAFYTNTSSSRTMDINTTCLYGEVGSGPDAWWDSSFHHREYATLSVVTGTTPSPFVAPVYVHLKACMNLSFGDVRFTSSSGTELPYFIGNVSGDTALFYVRTNSNITTSGYKMYIYYDNDTTDTTSNGDKVFDFFDSFDNSTLNLSKWQGWGSCGGSISNSVITLDGPIGSCTLGSVYTVEAPKTLSYKYAQTYLHSSYGIIANGFSLGNPIYDYSDRAVIAQSHTGELKYVESNTSAYVTKAFYTTYSAANYNITDIRRDQNGFSDYSFDLGQDIPKKHLVNLSEAAPIVFAPYWATEVVDWVGARPWYGEEPTITELDPGCAIQLISPTDYYPSDWATSATPMFKFKPFCYNAPSSCTLYVDSVQSGDLLSVTNNTNNSIVSNQTLSDGAHTWYVSCTGDYTNSSETRNFNIDSHPPEIDITSPTNATNTVSSFPNDYLNLTFSYNESNTAAMVQYPIGCFITVDGRGFSSDSEYLVYSSPTAVSYWDTPTNIGYGNSSFNVGIGAHHLQMVCNDTALNMVTKDVYFTITVETNISLYDDTGIATPTKGAWRNFRNEPQVDSFVYPDTGIFARDPVDATTRYCDNLGTDKTVCTTGTFIGLSVFVVNVYQNDYPNSTVLYQHIYPDGLPGDLGTGTPTGLDCVNDTSCYVFKRACDIVGCFQAVFLMDLTNASAPTTSIVTSWYDYGGWVGGNYKMRPDGYWWVGKCYGGGTGIMLLGFLDPSFNDYANTSVLVDGDYQTQILETASGYLFSIAPTVAAGTNYSGYYLNVTRRDIYTGQQLASFQLGDNRASQHFMKGSFMNGNRVVLHSNDNYNHYWDIPNILVSGNESCNFTINGTTYPFVLAGSTYRAKWIENASDRTQYDVMFNCSPTTPGYTTSNYTATMQTHNWVQPIGVTNNTPYISMSYLGNMSAFNYQDEYFAAPDPMKCVKFRLSGNPLTAGDEVSLFQYDNISGFTAYGANLTIYNSEPYQLQPNFSSEIGTCWVLLFAGFGLEYSSCTATMNQNMTFDTDYYLCTDQYRIAANTFTYADVLDYYPSLGFFTVPMQEYGLALSTEYVYAENTTVVTPLNLTSDDDHRVYAHCIGDPILHSGGAVLVNGILKGSWDVVVPNDTYQLVFTLDRGNFSRNDTIMDISWCASDCSAFNCSNSSNSTNITMNTTVANSPPYIGSVYVYPVSPPVGANIFCRFIPYDSDGDPLSANVTWYLNGTVYGGETGISCTAGVQCSSAGIGINLTSVGENWSCSVIVTDGMNISATYNSINATVLASAGIPVIAPHSKTVSMLSSAIQTEEFTLSNTGTYNLTHCNLSAGPAINAFTTFNASDFSVPVSSTAGIGVSFTTPPVGVYASTITAFCVGSPAGGTTFDISSISLTSASPGPGGVVFLGGGAGGAGGAAGNFKILPVVFDPFFGEIPKPIQLFGGFGCFDYQIVNEVSTPLTVNISFNATDEEKRFLSFKFGSNDSTTAGSYVLKAQEIVPIIVCFNPEAQSNIAAQAPPMDVYLVFETATSVKKLEVRNIGTILSTTGAIIGSFASNTAVLVFAALVVVVLVVVVVRRLTRRRGKGRRATLIFNR